MRWSETDLSRFEARRQAPSVPVPRKRQAKPAQRWEASETQIHEAVVARLRVRCRADIHWHHPATGELRDPGTARTLQRMGVRAGLPDILLVIDGRLHGLELKRQRGGRLSPEQIAMHAELTAAGAVVAVARGLDAALNILESWGALLP